MKKTIFLKLLMSTLVALSFVACSKENSDPLVSMDQKVIVINQGNFTEHSASISLYDETSSTIENRVYEQANGVAIGATVISGAVAPNKQAYLVCNNPDKIEIIDSRTAKTVAESITKGLATPRTALITDTRIYVTNWDYDYVVAPSGFWEYPNSYVAVYDLQTKELLKKVLVGTDAEGLVLYSNNLFVATREGVNVLDVTGDKMISLAVIRAADVTGAAKHLTFDNKAMIWASFPDKGVVQISPSSLSVIKVVEVPVDNMDGYITSGPKGEYVYTYHTIFNDSYMPEKASIYSVETSTGSVSTLFSGTYFYGLGVSPSTGNIFTAEVSFTSNSLMKIVTSQGSVKETAVAGIATCRYLFF
ncbi:MAG: DUF5074 domain-containing protein [Bacteroidales bacterium]